MILAPLLDAAPAIQLHTYAALAALALGTVQMSMPKGTRAHRTFGWLWAVLMFTVAFSSLFIHELRWIGDWSPIHLLSIYVLIALPIAVVRARRHEVPGHAKAMRGLFMGGLILAGLFTLWPGRIMHQVLFGS